MIVSIQTPTRAYLDQVSDEELQLLRKQLTYTNTGVQHLIKRHYQNHFWKARDKEAWQAHLENLQKDLKRCLVFEDERGLYIRPGSIPYLNSTIYNLQTVNNVKYPEPKKIPWAKPLPFDLHPYQKETCDLLPIEKHGNVSITTGAGKSACILKISRELGLNTVIVVPSKSIFEELLKSFEHHFGKKFVGSFGAGKKKLGKKFTVAIGDSLANIKPGSEEHKFFSTLDVLIVDESHEFAAESLEEVCHGVLAPIPYRFFFSATQIRNDGSGPLLQSIIGKTVCELTTEAAVKGGFICPHDFRIVSVESSNPSFESPDALDMKRMHLLKNYNIANFSAKLANAMATQGKQTLILVSELSQIAMIVPLLKTTFSIAHSEKGKERLLELGLDKVDNAESVEKFNKNEAKVLVGTSCIATGTNIYPCHNVINWVGGSSPIRVKQGAVGRAVRFGRSNPWASKCLPKEHATIWDFDIEGVYTMQRHLESRMECYNESGPGLIKYVRLKKS
jgi:superfamily II DNA or RNA helicase